MELQKFDYIIYYLNVSQQSLHTKLN